jgi:hypothetical protein
MRVVHVDLRSAAAGALTGLRVGHVDALVAHALGELELRVLDRGVVGVCELAAGVAEELLACLRALAEGLQVDLAARPLEHRAAVGARLRVGEVEALVAHALRELEPRLLGVGRDLARARRARRARR